MIVDEKNTAFIKSECLKSMTAALRARLGGGASKHQKAVPGFALIATISLMVLMIMIAIAMLSLSTSSLKSAGQDKAEAEAQSNARLGLMLALGELQKYVGEDRRTTVPASMWDTNPDTPEIEGVRHSRMTGVYRARTTDEELKNTLSNEYYERNTNFLTWLASHKTPTELKNSEFVLDGSFPDEVVLKGGQDSDGSKLLAGKIAFPSTHGGAGALAWAVVSDESQKASLPRKKQQSGGGVAQSLAQSGLDGQKGHQLISGLENMEAGDHDLNGYVSESQYSLLNPGADDENISRQLSPYAVSLLTDVKRGGFRKCLNLLLELDEEALPAEYRQMETYIPNNWGGEKDLNARKLSGIGRESVSENLDTLPIALLHNYYNTYRLDPARGTPHRNDGTHTELTANRPAAKVIDLSNDQEADRYWRGYGHGLRIAPIFARMRNIVWVMSEKVPGSEDEYQLAFISFPVITVWNPYNIDVSFDRAWVENIGGDIVQANIKLGTHLEYSKIGNIQQQIFAFGTFAGKPPVELTPGETKVFFPDFSAPLTSNTTRMTNEWPRNINDILTYGARYKYKVPSPTLRAPKTQSVEIGIRPNVADKSGGYGLTYYVDGWFAKPGMYKGSKLNDWTYNFTDHVLGDFIPGDPRALANVTMGSLLNKPTPVGMLSLGIKSMDNVQAGTPFVFDYPQRSNPTPHYGLAGKDLKAGMQASMLSVEVIPFNGDIDLSKYMNTLEDDRGVHDYLGYSYTPTRGSSYLTLCELPQTPLHSLGQLQHLPLQDENKHHGDRSLDSPTWTFGIGNSLAHPWLDSNKLSETKSIYRATKFKEGLSSDYRNKTLPMIDRLWVANSLLFDSYTFTTLAPQNNAWYQSSGEVRDLGAVAKDFFANEKMLPNSRLIPWPDVRTAEQRSEALVTAGRPKQDAYRLIGSELAIEGGFNINSTNLEAWKTLLASTLKNQVPQHPHASKNPITAGAASDRHVISRYTVPNGISIDEGGDPYRDGFSGYREITSAQIEVLAQAVVKEIKKRGPFRSLSEFVNRRRGDDSSDLKIKYGALEAALESEEVDINDIYGSEVFTKDDFSAVTFPNPDAVKGSKARGMPGYVSQADVLTYMAPVITARGDTFVLRAYGESKNAAGIVQAKAWCEAVVQRTPEFVDTHDNKNTELDDLTMEANKKFGRRLRISSFRWLNEAEINEE